MSDYMLDLNHSLKKIVEHGSALIYQSAKLQVQILEPGRKKPVLPTCSKLQHIYVKEISRSAHK